jgi:hypothetical protein
VAIAATAAEPTVSSVGLTGKEVEVAFESTTAAPAAITTVAAICVSRKGIESRHRVAGTATATATITRIVAPRERVIANKGASLAAAVESTESTVTI